MKNYLKTLTCIAISISTTFASFAQSSSSSSNSTPEWTKKNTSFITVNFLNSSVNYGRLVSITDKGMINISAGIGSWLKPAYNERRYQPCVEITYLSKKSAHHFEPGIGSLIYLNDGLYSASSNIVYFGYIGYRYQKPTGGLMIRIGARGHYIPGLSAYNKIFPKYAQKLHTEITPTLSIGYAF
jgi:hypothetical protein